MIFLDMDGVLADFVGSSCRIHGRDIDTADCWDYFQNWNMSENDFWQPINEAGRGFWADLEPFPWMQELVSLVKDVEPNFQVLTKPSNHPECTAGKMDWLHRHFGKRFRNYIFAPNKNLLASRGRLLIDDSDSNVSGFIEYGGAAYLLPQPWNSRSGMTTDDFTPLVVEIERLYASSR
jgi:5'(3')-deoxyribonucleotidase